MLVFFDLPLEIRRQIYAELEVPQQTSFTLGIHYAAEAPYGFPPHVLQISRQVSQEVLMAFPPNPEHPWKINIIAVPNAKLSLPDIMPDGLVQSANVRFNLVFGRFCGLRLAPTREKLVSILTQSEGLHKHIRCGMEEICRTLAKVPIKRDIEICWFNYDAVENRINLRSLCTFGLGKVGGEEEQNLASYLKLATGRAPQCTRSEEPKNVLEGNLKG